MPTIPTPVWKDVISVECYIPTDELLLLFILFIKSCKSIDSTVLVVGGKPFIGSIIARGLESESFIEDRVQVQ